MAKQQEGKYTKIEVCRVFDLQPYQFDKIAKDAGEKLPKVDNFINAFRIYNDETIDFVVENYKLKIVVDPDEVLKK